MGGVSNEVCKDEKTNGEILDCFERASKKEKSFVRGDGIKWGNSRTQEGIANEGKITNKLN